MVALGLSPPSAIVTKERLDGKNAKTSRYFLPSSLPLPCAAEKSFGTRPAGFRGYQKHFIVSVRARHIRGLPLADALSRRHVCFSVVKRAAGRQTGLNQLLPLSVSLLLPLSPDSLFQPPPASACSRRPTFAAPRAYRTHHSVHESVRPDNKLLFV